MVKRLNYEDSCRKLQESGYLEKGKTPPIPAHLPQYDDEELGFDLFRTFVEGEDFSNLCLPRTYFGRSEVKDTSFANTDLSESNLCWNDFLGVDFKGANLSGSDMRASIFSGVSFNKADLSGTDLRHSTFEDCSFKGANLTGATAAIEQKTMLSISHKQSSSMNWLEDSGPEPDGG